MRSASAIQRSAGAAPGLLDPQVVRREADREVVVQVRDTARERDDPRGRPFIDAAGERVGARELGVDHRPMLAGRRRSAGDRRGVAFAPQTSTTTRSPGSGAYAPLLSAASAAAPPGSATSRSSRQIARCASRIASSVDQHHAVDVRRARPRTRCRPHVGCPGSRPRCRRPARRRARPPRGRRPGTATSTGSTPTTRTSPAEPRGDAADQAAAAHRHEHRVGVGHLLGQLDADRALPGHDLGLVERVHPAGAGLGRALAGGRARRRRSSRRPRARRRPARARGRSWPRGRWTARRSRRDGRGSRAAYATASPKFPPLAAITPGVGNLGGEHLAERAARLERARCAAGARASG